MNTHSIKHKLKAILPSIPILLFICSCSIISRSFPVYSSMDIVFQNGSGNPSDPSEIGFMDSSGMEVKIVPVDSWVRMPRWNIDKSDISFYLPFGNKYLVGVVYINNTHVLCDGWVFYSRFRWMDKEHLLTVVSDSRNGKSYNPQIVYWDINQCSISKVLYSEPTFDHFEDPDYSVKGEIAFTRISDGEYEIDILNTKNGSLQTIAKGFSASWSNDGEQMVYTGDRGIYLFYEEGKEINEIIDLSKYYETKDGVIIWDDWPPMPEWSPDMKYIIYHRKNNDNYVIAKLDLQTMKEQILYIGGIFPDWK